MDNLSKDLIEILQYLLPGFISAWVFYSLTSFPKPSQFERIVQALIFTLFVHPLVYLTEVLYCRVSLWIGCTCTWSVNCEKFCPLLWAALIGVVFAYFSNNDKFHKLFRRLKITKETSYPSEWFGTFHNNVTYVVLHLEGERRLYGWPIEWPSEAEKGHFVLEQASWLTEENGKSVEIPLTGVNSIMVDVKQVEMVEFMKDTWSENGKERIKSVTAEADNSKGKQK